MVEYLAKYLLNSVGVLAKQLLKPSVDLEDVLHAFGLNEQIKEVFLKMDLRKKLEKKLGFDCNNNNRLSLLESHERPISLEEFPHASNPFSLIRSRIEIAEQRPTAKAKFAGAKLLTSIPSFLKRGKREEPGLWPPNVAFNQSRQSLAGLNTHSPKAEYFRYMPTVGSDDATVADSAMSVNGSALDEMDRNKKNFEFEELLESDATQRVSLTTKRLRTIESRKRLNSLRPRESIHKDISAVEERSDEGESSTMSQSNSVVEPYASTLRRSQTLYEFLKTSNPEASVRSNPAPKVEPFGKLIPRDPVVSFKSILMNWDTSSDEDELSSDFLKNTGPEDVDTKNIGLKVNRTLSRAGTQLQRIHHSIRRSATTRGKVQNHETPRNTEHTRGETSTPRKERRRRRVLSVPTVFDTSRTIPLEQKSRQMDALRKRESMPTGTWSANLSRSSTSIRRPTRPFSASEDRYSPSIRARRRDVSSLILSSTSEISTLPPSTPTNLSMLKSSGVSDYPDLYFISGMSNTSASKRNSIAATPPEMMIPFCLCAECLSGMIQNF
ncbi:hypothetical protein K493DRAFT_360136 [Basidiobolus meristosporus CBS 931.73]|uniref:Uncharacterized protein n=1 Tax=Basidiobolus meristosporus CBS 931.73 TaxID=1314790 RepID=A0A1Y1XL55_9FUNG|nr:hypothetical protein K493DRAFT_360136 [Basidiobolus meristosporus CBS 931.73]|eukprot:ORX86481.1 hypothetical protein K493DRAFT_360136 [Basidiobolus meristosporus CBS 931.73]